MHIFNFPNPKFKLLFVLKTRIPTYSVQSDENIELYFPLL